MIAVKHDYFMKTKTYGWNKGEILLFWSSAIQRRYVAAEMFQ